MILAPRFTKRPYLAPVKGGTVAALHLIERLVADGSLDLAEDLFIDPVSVTATEWAPQITGAYVADVGGFVNSRYPAPEALGSAAGLNFVPNGEISKGLDSVQQW